VSGQERAPEPLTGLSVTVDAWLEAAMADAERRGLGELKGLLEALAGSTRALRAADFNDDAAGVRREERGSDRP
jgi:hypothetical protein